MVNNNLSVKNNLNVANSLTTKNITNSNDIETNKIFPCKGSIIQFTCAQCYSHQDI